MWGMVGHEGAIRELDRSVRTHRLSHAYLIAGPPHVGKMTLALRLAQAVNCLTAESAPCMTCDQCVRIGKSLHSDIAIIRLEANLEGRMRKEIGIDEVREMQHAAALKPYEGRYRVFIVDGAERLSEEACNSLLKLLEEPPPDSLLLLLAVDPESLLPTIVSRCRTVQLRPLPLEEVVTMLSAQESLSHDEAQRLARLAMGCPGWAISAHNDAAILESRGQEVDRIGQLLTATLEERFNYAGELASIYYREGEEAIKRLGLWLGWWRDLLLAKEDAAEFTRDTGALEIYERTATNMTTGQIVGFITLLTQTIDAMEANANARLALEVMMLRMPGQPAG